MVSYSIAIRTIGKAGEKYQKLLNSIDNLDIRPEKVVVVLPEGYDLPKEQLGYEEFVFSKKGMIPQRIEALKYIDSEYTLFCDDDVEFKNDFIDKLVYPLESLGYHCSAGPLVSFLPPNNFKYKLASVLGGACTMIRNKKGNYIRILKTGGWSYNYEFNNCEINNTESLAWTCFFIKTDVMKKCRMQDELWLEKSGYAAFDDRVMFYKLVRLNYKICVVSDAIYSHNDAKTSTAVSSLPAYYCRPFNHFVFWHRYIYKLDSGFTRMWDIICIVYFILISVLWNVCLLILHKRTLEQFKLVVSGFIDAIRYIFSREYKNLKKL